MILNFLDVSNFLDSLSHMGKKESLHQIVIHLITVAISLFKNHLRHSCLFLITYSRKHTVNIRISFKLTALSNCVCNGKKLTFTIQWYVKNGIYVLMRIKFSLYVNKLLTFDPSFHTKFHVEMLLLLFSMV